MLSREEYVDKVVSMYCAGEENVYERYLRLYTRQEDESEAGFVARAADQDYDDAPYHGCVYQDLLDDESALSVEELKEAHGGHWGEHPEHPLSDWRYEVQNGDTRLGYWEWVAARLVA